MKNTQLFTGLITFAIFALLITSCAPQGAGVQPTGTVQGTGAELANPASVNCEKKGNKLEIRTAEDGSQTGVCVFPDGTECEEWAYYRGECGPGTQPAEGAAPGEKPTIDPALQKQAVDAVLQKLADQLKVDLSTITVTAVELVMWKNSCLGIELENVMCSDVITPGFKITLTANGETYVFHTDQTGKAIRQEPK